MRFLALVPFLMLCACGGQVGEGSRQALVTDMTKLAEQGNQEAQYHLGMLYNNGIGTKKDPQKAFEWFNKAGTSGEPLASYKLGCYFGGQFEGVVPVDPEKSFQYKWVAAKAGYSLAQYDVGNALFKQGKFDEAVRWWELAAKQGYPMALYNLSVIYKEGKGVSKNDALAYAYFKLAKLASEGKISQNAQASLDDMKHAMSSSDLEKAEQLVSSWKSEPTPITTKASGGLDEARRLVATSGK
jgi:uncharacterized protein